MQCAANKIESVKIRTLTLFVAIIPISPSRQGALSLMVLIGDIFVYCPTEAKIVVSIVCKDKLLYENAPLLPFRKA